MNEKDYCPIEYHFDELHDQLIRSNIQLVVVSKTIANNHMLELYHKGQRDFGENRVAELVLKQAQLPEDIRWHFIGHLQSKKVKKIIDFVHLIHSVDSKKLIKEINKQAKQSHRVVDVLLQAKIAQEDSKFGFELEEIQDLFDRNYFEPLEHIRIRGLMGMATLTEDVELIREEFGSLKTLFDTLKGHKAQKNFDIWSMGMSGDYQIAIEQGATMLRLGSIIFEDLIQK